MIRSVPMRRLLACVVLAGFVLPWSTPALARIWTDTPIDDATLLPAPGGANGGTPYSLQAVPEINGPGRVSTAGNVWMKTTNIGILGNPFTAQSTDPSAQWPGPSGVEYLFFIGLWIAAKNPAATDPTLVRRVSHNTEWRPPTLAPEDRIYQSYDGQVDGGRAVDDDTDSQVDEEFYNGRDDDFDGRIDEDYAAISQLMYTCELRDDTEQAENSNFAEKHVGFGLRVQQTSYSFAVPGANDFAAADFRIINDSGHQLDSVFVGFFVEQDVGPTQLDRYFSDDLPDARVPQGNFLETIESGDPRFSEECLQDTIKVRGFTMTDDDGDMNRTPGGSSFLLLGHTTDPTGQKAPRSVGFRMFRAYLPGTPYVQGGAPAVDIERYGAMSSLGPTGDCCIGVDAMTGLLSAERPEELTKGDYFSLCSVGPFLEWQNGESIGIQIALAVQACDYSRPADDPTPPGPDDLETYGAYRRVPENPSGEAWPNPERYGAMIENAIEVQKTFRGKYQRVSQGETPDLRGRETPVLAPPGQTLSLADCRDEGVGQTRDVTDQITVWFDFDCNFCTGVPGFELRPWLAAAPPPNPGLRLTTQDRKILLEWDNLSEVTTDPSTNLLDFHSYRVWKASNFTRPVGSSGPSEDLWALLAELYLYDELTPLLDSLDTNNDGRLDSLESATYPVLLNRQTGERIRPVDIQPCANGQTLFDGTCIQSTGAMGDTAYVTGDRLYLNENGAERRATGYKQAVYPAGRYRYEDPNVLNGFVYFYSVTGKDSTGQRNAVGGRGTLAEQEGRRGAIEQDGVYPQVAADSKPGGIYVVPNPYSGSAQWDLTPNASDPA